MSDRPGPTTERLTKAAQPVEPEAVTVAGPNLAQRVFRQFLDQVVGGAAFVGTVAVVWPGLDHLTGTFRQRRTGEISPQTTQHNDN